MKIELQYKDIISEFLNKKNVFAIVGASSNPAKYGYKVYKDIKEAGYKVYPVNPKRKMINNDKCYSSLRELPQKPDVIDIVTKPDVTEKIVREAFELGIKKIWMQPGSQSDDAIMFCKNNGIQVLYNVCIIVKRKELKQGA